MVIVNCQLSTINYQLSTINRSRAPDARTTTINSFGRARGHRPYQLSIASELPTLALQLSTLNYLLTKDCR
ncbi:MAG: hypothetical protein ACRC62_26965 [Microcoleus sp.]